MYDTEIEQIRSKKPRMAICYDFDKTLSPDDMQTFTLIPSLGMDNTTFWKESNDLAVQNLMDKNLAWMQKLVVESKAKRKKLNREYFHAVGKNIKLYKGVQGWFERINKYGDQHGIEIQHYIISSGLKELLEGTSIAHEFKRIYASSYLYDADDVAEWPAQAVNYTNKTQYIFRIAKGIFEEYDERVNDSFSNAQLYIPYENIVYVGDSATDIPCMRLVKSKGGYAIGVFDPEKNNRKRVYQLFNDGRINFYAPADYSARSNLSKYMKQIINEIAAREAIKTEQAVMDIPAGAYKVYINTEEMKKMFLKEIPEREKKKLDKGLKDLKELIEGNID